jgi:AraC-like DNA-binding protein
MSQVFETSDPHTAQRILRDASGGNIRIDAGHQRCAIRLDIAALTPAVRLDQISFSARLGLTASPLRVLVLCHIRSGGHAYSSEGSERAYGPGDVFLPVQPDRPCSARCTETDFSAAVIDPDLLSQVAATAPGRTQQPVRITSYDRLPPRDAALWRRTYAYVRDAVLGYPEAAAQPLVTASAARLLAATALAVFPNNALTEPTTRDRHDAHPDTLRRAVAFVDENARTDITVADIAGAAHVTIRAVQLAFRRHLGMTPLEYLRRVRLDHAHRDLIAADPASQTVTAIACRWGFPSPGRFASLYRQAYGVAPSHTLRNPLEISACALDGPEARMAQVTARLVRRGRGPPRRFSPQARRHDRSA